MCSSSVKGFGQGVILFNSDATMIAECEIIFRITVILIRCFSEPFCCGCVISFNAVAIVVTTSYPVLSIGIACFSSFQKLLEFTDSFGGFAFVSRCRNSGVIPTIRQVIARRDSLISTYIFLAIGMSDEVPKSLSRTFGPYRVQCILELLCRFITGIGFESTCFQNDLRKLRRGVARCGECISCQS